MDLETLAQQLPVGATLPQLTAALRDHGAAVLQAPPGAGKTTLVPLWLSRAFEGGKILMLEPRRLAARGAAERLAFHRNEQVGQSVGYRMRGDVKSGPKTQIEVVTEGIFTRMIQSDPELNGISLVIFDEFHERSMQSDLGLALSLEIRTALRPRLKILVMSATLDAQGVAELLGNAPVVTSQGRSFPVTDHFAKRSWRGENQSFRAFETAMSATIETALADSTGGILAFLPGAAEIHRTADLLKPKLGPDVRLHKLFGAMDFKAQRAAILPETSGRKLVLATSIAETSLTIEDIHVVVDGGLARRNLFDPGSGMSRLITERVTKAEAKQRGGRAGRIAPGKCYKLWTQGENGGLTPFPKPEIQSADLSGLLLECALWGATGPEDLPFLDQPPASLLGEARSLLNQLQALDHKGHITAHGRKIAAMPLHPRLAHMVALGGPDAPLIAALLNDPDILGVQGQRPGIGFDLRLKAARNAIGFRRDTGLNIHQDRLNRVKSETKRLGAGQPSDLSQSATAALAYPDRIAKRRPGDDPRYLLSGGKGARLDPDDALATEKFLVALDLDGNPSEASIRLAIAISEAEIRKCFPGTTRQQKTCSWSSRDRRVVAVDREMLGAIDLAVRPWKDAPDDQIVAALLEGIRAEGIGSLEFSSNARTFRSRVTWASNKGAELPDLSDTYLLEELEAWLAPYLGRHLNLSQIPKAKISEALTAMLSWGQRETLEVFAPSEFTAPTGNNFKIDYDGETPVVHVRLQEMFGLKQHPTIGPGRSPILFDLLSPANRPVQLTANLPGFWESSYSDVRKDLRGRYPKHYWPENPAEAAPTAKRKPRPQK